MSSSWQEMSPNIDPLICLALRLARNVFYVAIDPAILDLTPNFVTTYEVVNEQEVDVKLKASDSYTETAISAHKLILSARSVVFKKMFESDIGKASPKLETITLSEFDPAELEAFVEFIYSDGSILSEKARLHTMSLYRAADKYEIPHLRDLCRDMLVRSLDHSNALKVLEIAQIPFDKILTVAAFNAVKNFKSSIFQSTEFQDFVSNHPKLTVEIVKLYSGLGSDMLM